ncbi:hypothetical protein ACLOJK_020730 [Asimina triloba]
MQITASHVGAAVAVLEKRRLSLPPLLPFPHNLFSLSIIPSPDGMAFSLSAIRIPATVSTVGSSSRSTSSADRKCSSISFTKKDPPRSRKIFAGKSSYDGDSTSTTVTTSDKVLVPGGESDKFSSSTDSSKKNIADSRSQEPEELAELPTEDEVKMDDEKGFVSSESAVHDTIDSIPPSTQEDSESAVKQRAIPPPSTGQKIYEIDPLLRGFQSHLDYRYSRYRKMRAMIDKHEGGLDAFSRGYEKFGFIRSDTGVTYREWAPGAKSASLVEFVVVDVRAFIHVETSSGFKDSIPAWIKFSVQAPGEIPYNGVYYDPPEEEKYVFKHPQPKRPKSLRIYESHVGMSKAEVEGSEEEGRRMMDDQES